MFIPVSVPTVTEAAEEVTTTIARPEVTTAIIMGTTTGIETAVKSNKVTTVGTPMLPPPTPPGVVSGTSSTTKPVSTTLVSGGMWLIKNTAPTKC